MTLALDEHIDIRAGGGIPIGGIIPWMSSAAGVPEPIPPAGFEYCDGTNVGTGGSPLLGLAKPSLMRTVAAPAAAQRFVRGANTTVTYGGATAFVVTSADTHSHGGTTGSDNHSHQVNAHLHSIGSDGNHDHGNIGGAVQDIASGGAYQGGGFFHRHIIPTDGAHAHGNATGNDTPNTSSDNHQHSQSSDAVSHIPASVEVAMIIRVL